MFLWFQSVLVSTMSKHSDLSRSFGYDGQVNDDFLQNNQKNSKNSVNRYTIVVYMIISTGTICLSNLRVHYQLTY